MTQSAPFALPQKPASQQRHSSMPRVVLALMLREMSTTYGRSALGYLWAILEPAGGILLLTLVFSQALRAPAIGTNFPLFFASGLLPFMAYQTISQKIAVSLRFSRPLLFYPSVTYIDAMLARFLLNAMTQLLIGGVVIGGIIWLYDVDVILDVPVIVTGFCMALSLGAGIGTLNCYLLSVYPVWERAWAILNRPLFLLSCIFFVFDSIPQPYQNWLWWNPLVHCVGEVRTGVYATYDGTYVSRLYVFAVAGVTLMFGLLLLRRYHRDIIND